MGSKHEIQPYVIEFRHRGCGKAGTGVTCPPMCLACYVEQLQSQLTEARSQVEQKGKRLHGILGLVQKRAEECQKQDIPEMEIVPAIALELCSRIAALEAQLAAVTGKERR